jgi:hypothetical protein
LDRVRIHFLKLIVRGTGLRKSALRGSRLGISGAEAQKSRAGLWHGFSHALIQSVFLWGVWAAWAGDTGDEGLVLKKNASSKL